MKYRDLILYSSTFFTLTGPFADARDSRSTADEAAPTPVLAEAKPKPVKSSIDELLFPFPVPADGSRQPWWDEPRTTGAYDETSETRMTFDHGHWTITRKDLRSGEIVRFTQIDGDHGRVEVFQGKPVSQLGPERRAGREYDWLGHEDVGKPVRVAANVQMPRSMRLDVSATIFGLADMANPEIYALLPLPVRDEMWAERRAEVDGLNRSEAKARSAIARTAPSPF